MLHTCCVQVSRQVMRRLPVQEHIRSYGSYKPWFLECPLSWALELASKIPAFVWSYGALLQRDLKSSHSGSRHVREGPPQKGDPLSFFGSNARDKGDWGFQKPGVSRILMMLSTMCCYHTILYTIEPIPYTISSTLGCGLWASYL